MEKSPKMKKVKLEKQKNNKMCIFGYSPYVKHGIFE